jgi:hypothetical protein
VEENRLLTDDWSWFDMMNVTFQPKNMTPWELQEEFYHAANHFYDYRSAVRIGKLFGAEYGWRRFGLAFTARLGPFAARIASKCAKGSSYYQLRHIKWKYAPENADSAADRKKTA